MPTPPDNDFEDELEDDGTLEEPLETPWPSHDHHLHDPIPAHVAAALIDTDGHYPPPLDELLGWGDPGDKPDYMSALDALGLTQAHVPHLVRMARDRALNSADSETSAVWAPTYALQALQCLDATTDYVDLIPLLDREDDWQETPLTEIAKAVGEPALAPLGAYLQDRTRWVFGRASAADILAAVALAHPDLRDEIVNRLHAELEHAPENDPTMNGFLVLALVRLKATEALPVMRQAYELKRVEEFTAGSWEDILTGLGQPLDPDDPLLEAQSQRRAQYGTWPPPKQPARPAAKPYGKRKVAVRTPETSAQQAKKKAKRKAAAASRKTNRRK